VNALHFEVNNQPDSLRDLVQFYQRDASDLFASIPCPARPLLTGMGASYHAAMVATYQLQSLGIPAIAIEASDILQYGKPLVGGDWDLIYISQSGSSAEVKPILETLGSKQVFLSITNDDQSPLAVNALHNLPLVVDSETFIASKTYLNSLAVLWLLVRKWASSIKGDEFEHLLDIAIRVEQILQSSDYTTDVWLNELGNCQTLIFTGYGPHSATAKQSAQTVSEWVKIPTLGMGVGALRHGFIEIANTSNGFVVFTPSGANRSNALSLAEELSGYHAHVLVVENGVSRTIHERRSFDQNLDEFLTPLLDIIPVQIYANALADHLGIAPGFRHLQKVVSNI
jgi:glutamine---fructose-6-phosphate transaminase (isomerizing)